MSKLSGSSDEGNETTFYSALSHAPVRSVGNAPNLGIYRPKDDPQYGNFSYKSPAEGLLQTGDSHSIETEWSDDCRTFLAVRKQEYVVRCDGHEGTHTIENRYDKDWRHIKLENTE